MLKIELSSDYLYSLKVRKLQSFVIKNKMLISNSSTHTQNRHSNNIVTKQTETISVL
jgi:hypothetical protein